MKLSSMIKLARRIANGEMDAIACSTNAPEQDKRDVIAINMMAQRMKMVDGTYKKPRLASIDDLKERE